MRRGYVAVGLGCQEEARDFSSRDLEDGLTIDEVLEQFLVTRGQVQAVLKFAARSLDVTTPSR